RWRVFPLPLPIFTWVGVKVVCGLFQSRLGGVVGREPEPCAPPGASARPTQTPEAAPPVPGWAPAVLLGRLRLRPLKTIRPRKGLPARAPRPKGGGFSLCRACATSVASCFTGSCPPLGGGSYGPSTGV